MPPDEQTGFTEGIQSDLGNKASGAVKIGDDIAALGRCEILKSVVSQPASKKVNHGAAVHTVISDTTKQGINVRPASQLIIATFGKQLIPMAPDIDFCAISGRDRGYGCRVVGEEVPRVAAGVEDIVAAFEDGVGEPVGAPVLPDVFDR